MGWTASQSAFIYYALRAVGIYCNNGLKHLSHAVVHPCTTAVRLGGKKIYNYSLDKILLS